MNERHHEELHAALDRAHHEVLNAANLVFFYQQREQDASRLIDVASQKIAAAERIRLEAINDKRRYKEDADRRISSSGIAKLEKEKEELEDELRIAKGNAKEWEARAEEFMREAASWKRLAEPKKKTKQKKQ